MVVLLAVRAALWVQFFQTYLSKLKKICGIAKECLTHLCPSKIQKKYFILALDELYVCTFLNKPGSGFVDPIPIISIFTILYRYRFDFFIDSDSAFLLDAHSGLNLCRINPFLAPKREKISGANKVNTIIVCNCNVS